MTAGFVNSTGLGMGTGNLYWNDVRSALAGNPLLPVYDENGNYHTPLEGLDYQSVNPIAQMDYLRSRVNSRNYSARGSLYLIFEPIKNLKWRSTFVMPTTVEQAGIYAGIPVELGQLLGPGQSNSKFVERPAMELGQQL